MTSYTAEMYANTLLASIEQITLAKREGALKRFVALVYRNGDARIFDKILEALTRKLVAKDGGEYVELTFANKHGESTVPTLRKLFSKASHIESSIDSSLVAGVRVRINDEEELDWSLARRLQNMFARS